MLRRPHWAGTDCDVHISRLPPAGSALVSLPQGWTWQHHGREPRGKASRVWAGGEQGAGSRGTQGWHVTGTRRGGDFPAVMHKAPGARRGHCTGSLEGPCPWAQHAPRDMPSVPKSDLLLSPSPHCCLVQAPKPTRPLTAQPSAGPSLLRNAPPPSDRDKPGAPESLAVPFHSNGSQGASLASTKGTAGAQHSRQPMGSPLQERNQCDLAVRSPGR